MTTVKKQKPLSPTMQKINDWVSEYLTFVPFLQKMLFIHNLYIMVKAGLPIVAALKILSEQIENKKLRNTIAKIKEQVEKGRQLSEVLAEFPRIFPAIYVSMIAAGETAGKMEEALLQISEQMKKSHELTSRIQGAMIYPAVIVVAMIGISIEMVVFILPKIIVMFEDFKADLPLPTKILVAVVKFTGAYGLWVFLGFIAIIVFAVWLVKKPKIRRVVHAINLRWPIFGPVIKKINLARFTLTLSSLLQSAIPIIEAVNIASHVQSNIIYKENLAVVAESLKKGESLSDILARFPATFPPMVTQMIMVGEQSGQVEQMLKELAEYYGNEVDSTMKNFATIIEPVIILFMGLAVAGIAVAVIMPMYSLAQSF